MARKVIHATSELMMESTAMLQPCQRKLMNNHEGAHMRTPLFALRRQPKPITKLMAAEMPVRKRPRREKEMAT